MTILLDNVAVDITSSPPHISTGGSLLINIRADNYGGGSVFIEVASPNDPNAPTFRFAVLPNGTFTTDGTVKLDFLPKGILVRARLGGSSGADNVFVDILQ